MEIFGFALIIYTCLPFSHTLSGKYICRQNETIGDMKWVHEYCCPGHEEKNSECLECSPGFRGLNCTEKCPGNFYGKGCLNQCHCNKATHYCHHVCGCLQKSVIVRNTTVTNDSTSSVSVTSSYSTETCPETSTRPTEPDTVPTRDEKLHENHFHLLFGIACAIVVCVFFLAALVYWLRIRTDRKKEECRNHHNEVYGLEEANGVADNQIGDGQSAEEPLYDSNEEACYSILTLRVNNSNEYHKEPSSSKEPFFVSDEPYGFAYDYSRKHYDN